MYPKNNNFYRESIKKFGVTPRVVHWKNRYSQYLRFQVLTRFIKENIKTSSIVDAGCGFGDYYLYLKQNNLLPKNYCGIDCEDQMVQIALKHCAHSSFYKLDILSDPLFKADYYIASGALNLLTLEQIEVFIKRCYEHSKKGFIFNCLKGITFNSVDKIEIISIVRNYCHSSKITIREGYLDNDFTIFMVK